MGSAPSDQDQDRHFRTELLARDLRRRSVRAGAAAMAGQVGTNLLNLVATVVLARILTPMDYGLVAMVRIVTGFAGMFRDLGLSQATVQREAIGHEQVSTLFWINLGFGAALSLLILASAPLLAWFYGEPRLVGIALALAGLSTLDGLSIQQQALMRRQLRIGMLVLIENISTAAAVGLAIALGVLGFGYWALVALQAARTSVKTILIWIASGWRPAVSFRLRGVGSLLTFGGQITGARFLKTLSRVFGQLLVGRFVGAGQLGIYSKAAAGMLVPFDKASLALSRVAIPTLSRLQTEPERFANYYLKAVLLVAMVVMPLVVGLLVEAPIIVRLVLGEQWMQVAPLMRILAPVAVAELLIMTTRWVMISLGRGGNLLKWRLFELAAKATGMSIGVIWGVTGVAVGLLVSSTILIVPGLVYCLAGSPLKVPDIARVFYKPLAASAAAVVAVLLVQMSAAPVVSSGPLLALVFALRAAVFVGAYLAVWLLLPGGRSTLFELLGLFKELRPKLS